MRLDGITVLDLTQLLPGAYATQLLADMGAEVVKVEPPDGDSLREVSVLTPESGVFEGLNRGKRSVVLDLKREAGQWAIQELAADADAVITGYRSGVMERLGADYDTLRQENETLVYCSLSGYGESSPYRDRPGHDLTFTGIAGLLDLSRQSRAERPTLPPFSVADMAGGLFAAFAVSSSLLARERDGDGTYLDISILDVLLTFGQSRAPATLAGDDPGPPGPFTGRFPCYNIYETADGRYVTLAALEPKFWHQFCEVVDRPDLRERHRSDDPAVRDVLREELVDLFATKTCEEWLETCAGEGTTLAPVNTLAEALADRHVADRSMVVDGRLGLPARAEPPVDPATERPPELGEHTRAVLEAAGVAADEIDEIVEET
ncbi:CaiB/BaiF CoA transferase family protein [Natrinema gelatinilyticum]|uniref:CaiB/BaiF CoA transferase family protein n=1 Tax=Natrinema gelatinilyticum TaxID=2961571 RepID=UPI0020C5AB39|nr:CaiB/BaiF CoA-transferase family protein [Natrinema gelatinilyticum]